ncbi:MAG: phosphotransferase family protein [Desulfatitalea sp.]|nr:phosphotransferase family protein [Desulfatitalea sp.]
MRDHHSGALESTKEHASSMLKSVIATGKSVVHKIGPLQIRRLIESQDNVDGAVTIENVRSSGEVGASSGIVIFTATYNTGAGTVTSDLVLRHAPKSDARLFFEYGLAREFTVQKAAALSGIPVPEPLWLDAEGEFLSVPGYIMRFAEGVAPPASAWVGGPLFEASPEDRKHMIRQIMDVQVKIHTLDIEKAGLKNFSMGAPGKDAFEQAIHWYWQTWEWIDVAEFSRLQPIHKWLLENRPRDNFELMHGDASLHNYMFQNNQLTAVIDWEMSSLGRAEGDLALQCLGNKLFAAPVESGLPQPPSEQEWLDDYYRAGGRQMKNFDYYKKFSAYMVVVAISSLQRNMPDEQRQAQAPLINAFWKELEGG